MIRKVSKVMEYLEEELLEEVEPVEVSEKMASNIKSLALEGVKGTRLEGERGVTGKCVIHKRWFKRGALIAASFCALMGTAIGAICVSESIRTFFGENLNLILPSTQNINCKVSENGVTLTLESAVSSNSGGIIILHLTKDDGGEFKGNSELKELNVILEEGHMGYSNGWQLSENNKKLTYIINLNTDENIENRTVTIKGEDVVVVSKKEEIIEVDLSQVEKKVVLGHPYSDIVLTDTGFIGDKFFVAMAYTYAEDEVWEMVKLVDGRTGKVIHDAGAEWHEDSMQLTTGKRFYKGINPCDLPYLKLVTMYNDYEFVVKGKWEVAFKLQGNKNVKKAKKDYKLPIEGGFIQTSQIEVSAMGGTIQGEIHLEETVDTNGQNYYLPELTIILHKKDGSSVNVKQTGTSLNSENGYTSHIVFGEGDYREKEKLGEEFMEDMYKKEHEIKGVLPEQFIDVEQVESIEIEGVVIPLK